MKINKEKCIACKACHPYCPLGVISFVRWEDKKKSEVDQSDCVECGACLRSGVCPTDAIFMPELEWPREIRPQFSNPYSGPFPGIKGAMCGRAMVSPNLLSHLIKKIDKGKKTHAEAALELSRQCECGIFNPSRAERLLREMV